MYEGKNIHYSQTDQKPLCSFSGKVCNQRRLNNYGFCVRHILEDQSAPFKRCAYVAKSSRQTCTQPIPKAEEREYCNNHMQVLGMLPKKERKPKHIKALSAQFQSVHTGAMSDPGLLQNKLKPKQTGSARGKLTMGNHFLSTSEDAEDVYAFPADTNNDKHSKNFTQLVHSTPSSVVGSGTNSHGAAVTSKIPSSDSNSGQSSLAKIYPELAEKLEKIKPKVEAKLKTKVRNSRTMNSLQTKIAQNKIKDKLKRNQSSSNTSSQSQSPSHSFMSHSPGYMVTTSSPNHIAQTVTTAPPQTCVSNNEGIVSTPLFSQPSHCVSNQSQTSATTLPSLSSLNILNGLNLQSLNQSLEQLGLPVPNVSDIEQTLKQLATAANIPLDGSTLSDEKAAPITQNTAKSSEVSSQGTNLPPLLMPPLPSFSPQSGPPPPYAGVHHKAPMTTLPQSPAPAPSTPEKHNSNKGHQIVAMCAVNVATTSTIVTVPLVTRQFVPDTVTTLSLSSSVVPTPTTTIALPSASLSTMSMSASYPPFPNNLHQKLTLLTSSQTESSPIPASKISTEAVKQTSPPSGNQQQKAKPFPKSKPRSRNLSSGTKRPVPLFSLPMTVVKPRKVRKFLDENEVKIFQTKSAINLYNKSMKRKMDHHYMIYSGVASSDESDVSDNDKSPWQPNWLTPSSDEEAADEDESDYTLRTAKLALGRARCRRQCFQSRRSNRGQSLRDDTECLIKSVRESSKSTVKCLLEVMGAKTKSLDRFYDRSWNYLLTYEARGENTYKLCPLYKMRGTEKRRCLYKNNDDEQCKGTIVPYTNHCIKHVMYNVDQQLFEYCTAKFADNTQCCHPVIDVKHELPLCMEHGLKADNFLKAQDAEPKPKKPRKKTKPSALTRPPKKGKKKKNQRKRVRPQELLPIDDLTADTDVVESSEDIPSQHDTDARNDSDSDRADSPNPLKEKEATSSDQESVIDVQLTEQATLRPVIADNVEKVKGPVVPVTVASQPVVVVKDGVKPAKTGSVSQLEELENLTGLSELENVKMFGDLESASKLLEENDFQDVFNKLPDEAFYLFNNKGNTLSTNDELQDLEDSLALANRELNSSSKGSIGGLPTAVTVQQSFSSRLPVQSSSKTTTTAPINMEDAEEVLKQNIGPSSAIGGSVCNGDAEESIKAIARSLSNTGMMLAAEAQHTTQDLESPTVYPAQSQAAVATTHVRSASSLPSYSTLEYFPPNVAIQNLPLVSSSGVGLIQGNLIGSQNPVQISQVFAGQGTCNMIPQNVTVTPQGIITSHIPTSTARQTNLPSFSQTVSLGGTSVAVSQTTGTITLPSPQQLTAQQLSALVQQAAAQLPPLPPYTPRQQRVTTPSGAAVTFPLVTPVVVDSLQKTSAMSVTGTRPLAISTTAAQTGDISTTRVSPAEVVQHIIKQQEQILAQQLLQQKPLAAQNIRVTLPSSQNLGFSTILQQGQIGRLNTGVVQALPNITQQTKTDYKSLTTPVTLPSTNIVWTSPPNVTITSTNGLPRSSAQSSSKMLGSLSSSSGVGVGSHTAAQIKETFIDLTGSDPPPYDATQSVLAKTLPPPSYPTYTTTNTTVTGKS